MINLDSLKQELLDYIVSEGFAVFRGQPGQFEGLPTILWDTEAHPEYQAYLNVAKVAGARMIVFAHREFPLDELEEAVEQAHDCELPREELRSIERSLAEMRPYIGSTCSIEMAFDYEGRLYIYELVTDWFQTFLDVSELLMAETSSRDDGGEDESDGSFGGYYSKN